VQNPIIYPLLTRLSQFLSSRKIGSLFLILLVISLQNFTFAQRKILVQDLTPYYSINAPLPISGETSLCLVIGGVLGTYTAGGELGDVYDWTVTNSAGDILDNKSAGNLQTYKFLFITEGQFTVSLSVRRGALANFSNDNISISIQKGPNWALLPDYLLCRSDPTELTALDPQTPNLGSYSITWTDVAGTILGTGNRLIAQFPGRYLVESFLINPDGSPSCLLNNSTFVGPAIDFEILKSTTQLCEGKSVTLETDTPIAGEWFVQKVGDPNRISFGTAFQISVNYSELNGPGNYYLIFVAEDPNNPTCPSERISSIELLEGPQISISNIVNPDDCNSTDGSFDIIINSDLESLEILELNFSQTGISAGTTLSFPNISPKFYTITAVQNECESISVLPLESTNASLITNTLTVSKIDETCSPTGVNKGVVTLNFNQIVSNGMYRLFSYQSGFVEAMPIDNVVMQEIKLSAGKYILEISVGGCTYPLKEIKIENQAEVEFTIPKELAICESFELIPSTAESLTFSLTYPDGSVKSASSGNGFVLTEAGSYSLIGESKNQSSGLCAKTIVFNTTLSSQISYQPVLIVGQCFDPISYSAQINGFLPEEVSIRWLNAAGDIVGRFPIFYPADQGTYSLSVQPLKSGYCPGNPIEFNVVAPITSVEMILKAGKICPNPELATLTLTTNKDDVKSVKWIFYDPVNNREELDALDGLFEVQVSKVGYYEAVAYNKNGCEIGRTIQPVDKSSLSSTPAIESTYAACSEDNTISVIDPGDFASYEWYFDSKLVSKASTFKPDQFGIYTLIVTTEDKCQFTVEFTTYDVCNIQVIFPNAMQLDNPVKDFTVVVSQEVMEAELFIMNRQGELIYHGLQKDVLANTAILFWDGRVNGKNSILGTYSVVVILRNPAYGVEQKITGTLLILD